VEDIITLELPASARLFTCDAVSMYTNINTRHAFEVIEQFLATLPQEHIHPGLLSGLKIVMEHCVFQFGSDYFVQLSGTAMGAPPAPMYATMYFAIFEDILIPKYHTNLIFYRRFIDDGLGIWLDTDANLLQNFKIEMDSFGRLRWEFSALNHQADFLDVHLEIINGRITTRMHEKNLNLYLYLPPHSAHPPGVLKSIVFGRLQQITTLCSKPDDRKRFFDLLFQRLRVRGYSNDTLHPIFNEALAPLQQHARPRQGNIHTDLFLHVYFHPANPSSRVIQQIFRNTLLNGQDGFTSRRILNHNGNIFSTDRLIVAYHRPRNLGNRLSNRRLSFQRGAYGQFIFDDRLAPPF